MLKYLSDYVTCYEKALNIELMKKSHDKPLLEFILESWKSLEVIQPIKILGWTYTDKESEIDVNKYIFKRERGKKQKEKYDFKWIDDSRVGLLTVHVQLQVPFKDPKTGKNVLQQQKIQKSMLIPIQDEDGLYHLNGKDIYMVYQMTEKSTYTAPNSVILKSLMPFATRRYVIDCSDTNGNFYKLPYYTIELFHKDVEIMLLYATGGGLHYAIQFALNSPYLVMDFVDDPVEDDLENIYFKISGKLFIRVNKELFDMYTYVRSVVGGILKIVTSHITMEKINDGEIWLKKLGAGNIAKGLNLLSRTKRLLDETTGKILRLDIYNKHDVLSLTRWMCEEYNDLRMKDNMDLANKRLRSNEIFEALLTNEFSFRANRIMSLGKKATLENYREMFRFPGDILIQAINTSGIQRYNECINDMTFFTQFKYTIKGPNSLGNKNSNNISAAYRGIHHSFIGHIDLTVCGNSDPGTSGMLTPYGKMDGLYFDDSMEPDDFIFDFKKSIEKIVKRKGITYVSVKFDTKEDYYKAMNLLRNFNDENIHVSSTSREGDLTLVIEPDLNMDEKKDYSNPTTKKRKKKSTDIDEN